MKEFSNLLDTNFQTEIAAFAWVESSFSPTRNHPVIMQKADALNAKSIRSPPWLLGVGKGRRPITLFENAALSFIANLNS